MSSLVATLVPQGSLILGQECSVVSVSCYQEGIRSDPRHD